MFLPMWINEISQNQDKSINEKSVSSISTNWSIQSISIKSFTDFYQFINWQIDTDFCQLTTPGYTRMSDCNNQCYYSPHYFRWMYFVRLPTVWPGGIPTKLISGDHMSLVDEEIFALQDKGLLSPVPMNLVNSFHPFLPVWHCETYL